MLHDGSTVHLRPITSDDKDVLRGAFERLSEQSRYRRFMGGIKLLTPQLLAYLTEVDGVDHFAWVAIDPNNAQGVGVARYVRLRDDPVTAEAAVTVADDWHGRGLGTFLLDALGAIALENGIRTFRATVLTDNKPMLDILRDMGARLSRDSAGVMCADIDLSDQAKTFKGTTVYEALRGAARGHMSVVHDWNPPAPSHGAADSPAADEADRRHPQL